MTYKEIVAKVADDLGLSVQLVDRAYKSYWKAIREHVKSLPLMENLSDKEFQNLRPNVNIPSLGKLYVTIDRYHGMKKYFEAAYKNYKGNKYKTDNSYVKD